MSYSPRVIFYNFLSNYFTISLLQLGNKCLIVDSTRSNENKITSVHASIEPLSIIVTRTSVLGGRRMRVSQITAGRIQTDLL